MRSDRLDHARLAELRALTRPGGADLLAKLVEVFVAELPARTAAVRAAIEAGDSAATAEAAHALQGSSATLGAKFLAEVCDEIQDAVRAADSDRARRLLSPLMEEAMNAEAALAAEAAH